MNTVNIENEDLAVEHRDAGPWRSYHLSTYGSSMPECLANAAIEEIDQDGGELRTVPLEHHGSGEVYEAAVALIEQRLNPTPKLFTIEAPQGLVPVLALGLDDAVAYARKHVPGSGTVSRGVHKEFERAWERLD